MQISNTQINKVFELHLHKVYAAQSKPTVSAGRGFDQLFISAKAADIQRTMKTVASLPSVRPEVVNGAKQMIQSGNYNTNGMDIAESMFSSANPFEARC